MYPDFKDLLSSFNAHNVKYLIVGDHAVSFHSQPRATKDLDLFIQADPANARVTWEALRRFGVPLAKISVDNLADPNQFIRFGQEPVAVDVMPNIDGLDFASARERRIETVVDPESGQMAFVVSRDDLIVAKLAAGRARDIAEVEEIRDAASSKNRSKKSSGTR